MMSSGCSLAGCGAADESVGRCGHRDTGARDGSGSREGRSRGAIRRADQRLRHDGSAYRASGTRIFRRLTGHDFPALHESASRLRRKESCPTIVKAAYGVTYANLLG